MITIGYKVGLGFAYHYAVAVQVASYQLRFWAGVRRKVKVKVLINLALIVVVTSITGTASATIIPAGLDIDFREMPWDGANGQPLWTVGNVTAEALLGDGKLFQDNVDGLGILGGEDDEIDDREQLKVSFDTPMALLGVWITDLFRPDDGDGFGESGRVELTFADTTMTTIFFTANDPGQDDGNGELFVQFNTTKAVATALFSEYPDRDDNEFSVAGFNKVPEPTTLALLGLGLLGFGATRNRWTQKK